MTTTSRLPFAWQPITKPKPDSVSLSQPRHRVQPGRAPSRALKVSALPPLTRPAARPATTVADGTDGRLSAAAAARHGVVVHRREDLMTLLSLSDTELAHLICDGAVVEVPIGVLTRYALADGIPTDVHTRGAGL